jgi:hypothetical protein
LKKQLLCRIQQRLVDVRSGIEEADLDRSDVLFHIGKQLQNIGLLTGVDADCMGVEACGLQLVDQLLRLGCVTPADANRITALGKPPGDGCADSVACADKYRYVATSSHPCSPNKYFFDTLEISMPGLIVNPHYRLFQSCGIKS